MIARVAAALLILLTASAARGEVVLMGSNGNDWTVGQFTDELTHKMQCLMRWDSSGRTFTYALFKEGAVLSFRKNAWDLADTTADTSVSFRGNAITVQRLDRHTLGLGWGERPSPLPTVLFNAFIQSGDEMTIRFEMDEGPWVVSFPASTSVTDGWLKCLAKLDEN